jgi:hypothetical protein
MRCLMLAVAFVLFAEGETVSNRIVDPVDDPPQSSEVSKIIKQDGPPFQLDPKKPWSIQLGRGGFGTGSTWVHFRSSGHADLFRDVKEDGKLRFEFAKIELAKEAIAKIVKAIDEEGLAKFEREYRADAFDGTQWHLVLTQGDRKRTTTFRNHFPDAIVRFAKSFDRILLDSANNRIVWGLSKTK